MPGAHGCTGCLAASWLWVTASRGHRAAGVKGEPSCHTPGQLTGSRDGQGLALSPGSRGYDHLFHSCPPPPSLGGQAKALDSAAKAEEEEGQLGLFRGGEEWLFKREVWRAEQETPGTERAPGRMVCGLEGSTAQIPLPKGKVYTNIGIWGVQ